MNAKVDRWLKKALFISSLQPAIKTPQFDIREPPAWAIPS